MKPATNSPNKSMSFQFQHKGFNPFQPLSIYHLFCKAFSTCPVSRRLSMAGQSLSATVSVCQDRLVLEGDRNGMPYPRQARFGHVWVYHIRSFISKVPHPVAIKLVMSELS
jgi:hypothetical protein